MLLCYGVGHAPGLETTTDLEGKVVVFEASLWLVFVYRSIGFWWKFCQDSTCNSTSGLWMPSWPLASMCGATVTFGGEPSVEIFTKHYCLDW